MRPLVGEAEERRLLIVDTGPIREMVIYKAVFTLNFQSLWKDLRWLRAHRSYSRLSSFISRFREKVVSCGTVVELHNFIQKTPRAGQRVLWGLLQDEFRSMAMSEQIIQLLAMKVELLAKVGPVDTSLMELARVHKEARPVILTIDSGLLGECERAGFRVTHLDEVLTS